MAQSYSHTPRRSRASKRRSRRILIGVAVVLLAVVGVLWLYSSLCDRWKRKQYPLRYETLVCEAAANYRIPEAVLYAVMRTESSFSADAVSPAGAVGLMQITPDTYNWLSSHSKAPPEGDLTDPAVNIAYGAYYLSILYDEFGDWRLTWAAYNAGPNRVRNWITTDPTLQHIPIAETETYVTRVSRSMQIYESLYFSTETNGKEVA